MTKFANSVDMYLFKYIPMFINISVIIKLLILLKI